jgi:hypothetical protein
VNAQAPVNSDDYNANSNHSSYHTTTMNFLLVVLISVIVSFFVLALLVMIITAISAPLFRQSTPTNHVAQPSAGWVAFNLSYSTALASCAGYSCAWLADSLRNSDWVHAPQTCTFSLMAFMLLMTLLSSRQGSRPQAPPLYVAAPAQMRLLLIA